MTSIRRPDIVVGIDIGQTCSGVAYSIGPDWSEPRTLNRWPGYHGTEKADKVATRIGYSKSSNSLANWGFESLFSDDTIILREQFKLTLDADYEDDRGFTCQQARQWYFDYLRCLHREIEKFFDSAIPNWRNLNVEYSFSTPTTWTNPAMIASIEKLVRSSGFASTELQNVRMALTEAEAAAIEASTTRYRPGDIFLICDAGGGTTDANLLRVKSTDSQIKLEPLDHVEGVAIGSTLIDFRMGEHIVQRLEMIREHLDGDLYCLAEEMLMGRFQIVKHSFPNPVVDQFWLDVKGLAGTQSFPEAGITNSRISIDRETLRDIFDQQVHEIFRLIDERLLALDADLPHEQVSYIILSGGLGSSPYLYEEIKKRYEMNFGFSSRNTAGIRIMRVLEPQLAVVRGLVRERTQQLGGLATAGEEVLTTRRCRNSYGVVVRELYNEARHQGLPTTTDPRSNTQWVENRIDWLIKEGEEISLEEGVRRPYGASLSVSERAVQRQARVVMSTLPINQLPQVTTQAGCQHVAVIKYQLTENDMELKNKHFWKMKKKYWRAHFWFVVRLGPADLRFQIVGKNGMLSSDHDSLQVEFLDLSVSQSSPRPPAKTNGAVRGTRRAG